MEFDFGIGKVTAGHVMKIDNTLTPAGYRQTDDLRNKMALIIDNMGKASAVAQKLKIPVTSADKLTNSNHILYLMAEHSTPERFAAVGILKMGWKKLYLYDKTGVQSEAMVYCLLDFYIHEPKQRKGYGKHLIQHMLQDIDLDVKHLAIDKPTEKMLQFMWKHYKLSKLVNQGNNFVIYEEFFDEISNDNNNEKSGKRASAYMCQPMFGRHGAHKHHDTMGEIVQSGGNATSVKFKYNQDADFVKNQLEEVNPHPEQLEAFHTNSDENSAKRDLKFHHNSLW